MANVMLDNWGLSECAWWRLELENGVEDIELRHIRQRYYRKNQKVQDICWQNMLTSLVLWDHLYINFGLESRSADRLEMLSFQNVMEKLAGDTDIFKSVTVDASMMHQIDEWKYVGVYEKMLQRQRCAPDYDLIRGGIKYILKANILGFDYIPHPRRAAILQKTGIFSKRFDRVRYLDILDEEVRKYMDEVNKLMGHQLQTVCFPVLYKFIEAHAGSSKQELEIALELRENKNVKSFRKSLDKIQRDYSEGNMLSLGASLKETKEICETITGEMYKRPLSFSVSLGLSPSIDMNIDFPRQTKSKLHTTFLYDLASFALKGRPKNKYVKSISSVSG